MLTLAESVRRQLVAAAVVAPSRHNTQPWRFRFSGDVVEVHRDPEREPPTADPDRRILHLTVGAAVFNLRVAAARLGYRADVRIVSDSTRPTRMAEIWLSYGDPDSARVGWLFDAIWRRRTNRRPFLDRRVAEGMRCMLSLGAELESAELRWIDEPARLRLLTMVTVTADLEDCWDTAEHREWIGGAQSLHRAAGVPEPADEARSPVDFEANPQLAVLSTAHDEPADWFTAGQATQRVLLEATAHGVSTSLLNHAIEDGHLRWLVRDPLGTWNRPQAIIRFGYGPDAPATPRRPFGEFILG